jgi:hypothetical protein
MERINLSLLKDEKKLSLILFLPVVESKRGLQWIDYVDWLFLTNAGDTCYVRYLGHSDGDNFLLHSILFIVLFQISN